MAWDEAKGDGGGILPTVVRSKKLPRRRVEGVDLVVMGSYGGAFGGVNKDFFGSTAEKSSGTAGCPVLTVPLPIKRGKPRAAKTHKQIRHQKEAVLVCDVERAAMSGKQILLAAGFVFRALLQGGPGGQRIEVTIKGFAFLTKQVPLHPGPDGDCHHHEDEERHDFGSTMFEGIPTRVTSNRVVSRKGHHGSSWMPRRGR